MITLIQIMFIVLCLFGQAFYAGIETGIISIHKMRLRHLVRKGMRGAAIIQGFLDRPDRLLGTTLVGTNICLVVTSVLATSLCIRLLGKWGEPVSAVGVAAIGLVFCEYLPKTWFHSRPILRSRRFAGMLRLSEWIFRPISVGVVWLTRWIVPGARTLPLESETLITRDDLKVLARETEQGGELTSRERVMIHRVFELSGRKAVDVMVPRSEMVTVEADTSLSEFFELARRAGLTRFPVRDSSRDAFVGIINVFFVLSAGEQAPDQAVTEYARPPVFIDENMPADEILPRMRRSRQPLCLVRNGEGSVTGLVTTEDVLEEIVGEL